MTDASPSHVAAVVVYFRTPGPLQRCLQSLEAQTLRPDETIVIDNSSIVDGIDTPPVVPGGWRWHPLADNPGFAAACNAGAAVTSAEFILFLNADVELAADALAHLTRTLVQTPGCALAGPRIIDADGEIELSARAFPSFRTGILGRSSLATRLLRRAGRTPSGVSPAFGSTSHPVDWVSGACMLVRRAHFDTVGGFDEGFWMYWEDADLCRRLSQRGLSTWFAPDAVARHRTSSSGRSERTIRAFHASAARYFDRHLAQGRAARAAGRAALAVRCRLVLASQRRGRVAAWPHSARTSR